MDYVHIDNLRVRSTHGHYESEWSREQDFEVSVRAGIAVKAAGESDKLHDTVDYDFLKACVLKTMEGERRYLTEKLAEDIIAAIFKDLRITEVTVTIRKLEIWDNGVPGTTITRFR